MLGWLSKLVRPRTASAPLRANPPRVRPHDRLISTSDLYARWDAAQTTDDNVRHWAYSDAMSAVAAGSPEVRAILRQRARYECHENNCYARGIVRSMAYDLVGTGPRLEMMLDEDADNQAIESLWREWTKAVGLARKLRTAAEARIVDGEYFLLFTTNPLNASAVKLDLALVEADQCTTPGSTFKPQSGPVPGTVRSVDGVVFDDAGNPVEYHFLRTHPGDSFGGSLDVARVPASHVIHSFRPYRIGQRRGVSEVAPALPLFAQMRRYGQATLDAAEAAARIPFWLYTTAPANTAEVEALATMDLERNSATVLPEGWQVGQMDAKHPNSNYAMFKSELIREVARVMGIPYNLAAGDSSGYNYSSGRLDHQNYFRQVNIDRAELEDILDRIFAEWLREARLIPGYLPATQSRVSAVHRWGWDTHLSVDPQKDAAATAVLWQLGLVSDDEWLRERNISPDEHYSRMESSLARRRELGMPLPGFAPMQVVMQSEDGTTTTIDPAVPDDEEEPTDA